MNAEIRKLLFSLYSNPSRALFLVEEYELDRRLHSAIRFIRKHIKTGQRMRLFHSGGVLLTLFNNRVSLIADPTDKEDCQQLIMDVLESDLSELLEKATPEEKEVLVISIVDSCELHGYDFEDTKRRLKLSDHSGLKKRRQVGKNPRPDLVLNYELNLSEEDCTRLFAKIMSMSKIFKTRKDVKAFFVPSSIPRAVDINFDELDMLLVLVSELHRHKLLLIRGQQGKFIPMQQMLGYSADERFRKIDVSRKYNKLCQNKKKYERIRDSVYELISPFVPQSG